MKSHSVDMASSPMKMGVGVGVGERGWLVFVLGGLYCGEPWREEWYMEGYHFLVFGGLIQGLGLIDS